MPCWSTRWCLDRGGNNWTPQQTFLKTYSMRKNGELTGVLIDEAIDLVSWYTSTESSESDSDRDALHGCSSQLFQCRTDFT